MKREFLISRLDEPNIAHAYVCESDQNLLNNIRILCTRQPETLRYFVPEELFWEIKNGETVAITWTSGSGSTDTLSLHRERTRPS